MSLWDGIWDVFWWTIWFFAFFAYLWVVFAIITDLFRDDELNGWWKAVWIILLLFVPFLTALIYLIARGKGMATRTQSSAARARRDTDTYIRETAGASASPSDEIRKAKALLDAGTITQQEYDLLKAKALAHQAG